MAHRAHYKEGLPEASVREFRLSCIVTMALNTHGIKMRFGRSDHKWTTLNTGVNGV